MKKTLCFALMLCMLLSFTGCKEDDPFEVYSCGDGFYFNRSGDNTYKIKELGLESNGNCFVTDEYFVSEELGEEYVIKKGLFKVGSVYLAKKSDHYNSEQFRFNVQEYNNNILAITPEMNYVELYSEGIDSVALQVQVMSGRKTPLDLTLNNVKVLSPNGIPVIFSGATTDVNIILKGKNELISGDQIFTREELLNRLKDKTLDEVTMTFYDTINELQKTGNAIANEDIVGALNHALRTLGEAAKDAWEGLGNAVDTVVSGIDGFEGAAGATTVIISGGLSFSGDGSIVIKGGKGANGSSASGSITGSASGGKGGDGGDAVACNAYLDLSGQVHAEGGMGGLGGQGSQGWLGASGSTGANGQPGIAFNVAHQIQQN